MTLRTCLRCDWEGAGDDFACPRCGVPLYDVRGRAAVGVETPATHEAEDGGRAISEGGRPLERFDGSAPSAPRWDARSAARPSRRSIETFAAVALVLILGVGTWLVQREGRRPIPPAQADATTAGSHFIDGGPPLAGPPVPAGLDTTAGGIPFSFARPKPGWEEWEFSITRSIVGSQGAESIVFWTSFNEDERAGPCARVLGSGEGASAAELANVMASAPGTELVDGPSDVTVGGRPAEHVELIVRRDVGCDPGYFFRWPHDQCWGACWLTMRVGYRIHVWVVEGADTPIVFAGATSKQADLDLERDIQRIIRSVRFDA